MKIRNLLVGVALGAITAVGMTSGAQAFGLFIDGGDYWHSHHYDYCYYHDCGDSWYERHHRHYWRDRDSWRGGGWHDHGGHDHGGDWGHHHDHDGDGHGDHHDGDHHDGDRHDGDGDHHHHDNF
jgi:hypothetical protein